MQEAYAERHELLSARIESKLGGALVVRPATVGTFSVAELNDGLDDTALARNLAQEGIESIALSATYVGPVRRNGLILGHAIATPEAIRMGVDTIERLVSARGA